MMCATHVTLKMLWNNEKMWLVRCAVHTPLLEFMLMFLIFVGTASSSFSFGPTFFFVDSLEVKVNSGENSLKTFFLTTSGPVLNLFKTSPCTPPLLLASSYFKTDPRLRLHILDLFSLFPSPRQSWVLLIPHHPSSSSLLILLLSASLLSVLHPSSPLSLIFWFHWSSFCGTTWFCFSWSRPTMAQSAFSAFSVQSAVTWQPT